mmetsp:Transcript_12856/g.18503  ORF Transcript_12856/g.18503 Transcript_12856/m.18503 type:complete len:201 (-) Transcript_12856:1530-2132(-)
MEYLSALLNLQNERALVKYVASELIGMALHEREPLLSETTRIQHQRLFSFELLICAKFCQAVQEPSEAAFSLEARVFKEITITLHPNGRCPGVKTWKRHVGGPDVWRDGVRLVQCTGIHVDSISLKVGIASIIALEDDIIFPSVFEEKVNLLVLPPRVVGLVKGPGEVGAIDYFARLHFRPVRGEGALNRHSNTPLDVAV